MKGIIGIIAIVLAGIVIHSVLYYSSVTDISITVTDKERITESSGSGDNISVSSKYLVFTENETFENTDESWKGKWNSSDIQGNLKKDSTYTVTVIGWRLHFFSSYRNILEIK